MHNLIWGVALVVGGMVSLIIAPPSAVAIIALACIAIFAGGYLSMVHFQCKHNDKDNDGKES